MTTASAATVSVGWERATGARPGPLIRAPVPRRRRSAETASRARPNSSRKAAVHQPLRRRSMVANWR